MEGPNPIYFFTALVILLSSISSGAGAARPQKGNSEEFIRTSCSNTTYPKLCYTSLSTHANFIQTSPKLLARAALSVALNNTRFTSAVMIRLSHSHGLSPREAAAMRDCVEEVADSVDELRNSMAEMTQIKGTNFDLMMGDIQTWVSAALTDDDTCTDGFSGSAMAGKLKSTVRGRIVKVAQLTSNALALINGYASTFRG
ncbi:21 kDa protein-like [Diospyros lotus]|uniref:21 kDa protein-like n=1 Tax=Diospyros lotus TaxID=55363 RepID=UPI002250DC09|nr:21 kDa protein-like [Diospyros lotus]